MSRRYAGQSTGHDLRNSSVFQHRRTALNWALCPFKLGSMVSAIQSEHGQRHTVKTETLAMKSGNQTNLRDLGGRGGVRLNRPSCQGPADRRNSMRSRLPSWSSSLSIGSPSSHDRLLLSSTFLQRSIKNANFSRLSPNGNPSFAKQPVTHQLDCRRSRSTHECNFSRLEIYLSHKIPNNRARHPPRPSLRPIRAFTCVQAYDLTKRACSMVHHLYALPKPSHSIAFKYQPSCPSVQR